MASATQYKIREELGITPKRRAHPLLRSPRAGGSDPMLTGKPLLGVSACLLGHEVRFDTGHKRDRFLLEVLGPFVQWQPICPELEVGMGLPREPVRLVGPGQPRLRGSRSGADWTEAMNAHAEARVEGLGALDGYVLKSKSPSCGMERVKVYVEGGGMPSKDGVGLFAAALMRRWPSLPVEEEGRLCDPGLRDSFLERVLVHQRLRKLWDSDWRLRDLIAFHTAHKMTVLAHDVEGYRRLGRLVAGARVIPRLQMQDRYQSALMSALAKPAAPGRHANTLQHLFGHLKGRLDAEDARELLASIEEYRRGLSPLAVPTALLRHHVRRLGVSYVAAQTYLDPYPRELALHDRA
jgi:uncharacterized protein YbgA (DUF1722 family)/uncharacterized protein YbbK (DUF523 family)